MTNGQVAASPLIPTSMSALGEFERCRRRFEFGQVQGWVPRGVSKAVVLGTAFHAALSAGYSALRELWVSPEARMLLIENERRATATFRSREELLEHSTFLRAAVGAAHAVSRDRDGLALDLSREDRTLLEDMACFYWEEIGHKDLEHWAEILAVEEPAYIQIGPYLIRNTFDLVVREFMRDVMDAEPGTVHTEPVVYDHKTTGDVQVAMDFLQLDPQLRSYYAAARGKFGRPTRFVHNFIAREVPPGYGHRSELTATGKKRAADALARMKDPNRYLRRVHTPLTDRQVDLVERELVAQVTELANATARGAWPRTRIKTGPFSCTGCPFFAPCVAELDGRPIGEANRDLLYIVRGSEEWNALQLGEVALNAT